MTPNQFEWLVSFLIVASGVAASVMLTAIALWTLGAF